MYHACVEIDEIETLRIKLLQGSSSLKKNCFLVAEFDVGQLTL